MSEQEIKIESKKSKYIKKEKPNYRKWIDTHRDQILSLDPKTRSDYVYQHLNEDLKLNKSPKEIYQLLYRTGLINHKQIIQEPNEVASTTITQLTNDILNLCQGKYELSQPLIQRYIKVLSDLNKDLNELKEIKNEIEKINN